MHYFTGLNTEDLEVVKGYIAFEKKINKGQTLLHEEDESEYMYLIVSGAVKVYKRSVNGKEQILNIASTGESLNDVSTFDGGNSAMDMLAMTPVHLLAIKKMDIKPNQVLLEARIRWHPSLWGIESENTRYPLRRSASRPMTTRLFRRLRHGRRRSKHARCRKDEMLQSDHR